jgi:hypothetical protein
MNKHFSLDVVTTLHSAGAYVNMQLVGTGTSVLHEAVGRPEVMALLLRNRAFVDIRDLYGRTPLREQLLLQTCFRNIRLPTSCCFFLNKKKIRFCGEGFGCGVLQHVVNLLCKQRYQRLSWICKLFFVVVAVVVVKFHFDCVLIICFYNPDTALLR